MKVTSTSPDVSRYINPGLLLLAVVYPFVTHFSVVSQQTWPSLALIYVMLCLLTLEAFVKKYFLLQVLCGAALVLAIIYVDRGQALLNFYPIIIVGSLFVVFVKTLLPGETPIITLFAMAIENKLSAKKIIYTRRVTQLWSVIFLGMLIESVLLATYASQHTWSLFTNFINYLLIGSVFVAEFIFRVYHFKDEAQPGFFEFANQIRKLRISNVLQQKKS